MGEAEWSVREMRALRRAEEAFCGMWECWRLVVRCHGRCEWLDEQCVVVVCP